MFRKTFLNNFCSVAGHMLWEAAAVTAGSAVVIFCNNALGSTCHRNNHMNDRTLGFIADHCLATEGSVLTTVCVAVGSVLLIRLIRDSSPEQKRHWELAVTVCPNECKTISVSLIRIKY